ncbi:MAG: ComEC/Rec2 family competence protein, partial [Candidatus Moraniibacteriota bacterium]
MKVNKAKIFLLFSLSFILGIFIASFFYPSVFGSLFLYFIFLLALILFFIFYKNKLVMLATFCILIFIFGFWLTQKKIDKINSFKNSPQEIDFSGRGVILVEPKIKETRQEIIFAPENKNYNILIQESIYQNYTYGEELQLACKLETPKNREDSDFDYQAYLAREDIFYLCQKPKIEKTGKNQGNFFYASIIKLKNKFSANISALIPSPESGLLEGLIIGGDDKLSKKIQDNFSRTGMTHIVAVSGYNITIVAQYLMLIGIFFGLWRQQAFWFALLGVWIFILMTGFPASAIRAGV